MSGYAAQPLSPITSSFDTRERLRSGFELNVTVHLKLDSIEYPPHIDIDFGSIPAACTKVRRGWGKDEVKVDCDLQRVDAPHPYGHFLT